MTRKKVLSTNKAKAIDGFNLQMNTEIGDEIESIDKSIEHENSNEGIPMDPILPKDPNDLKLEIGTETGIANDDFYDDYYTDDEMYIDTGDLIPREIIREAERQLANERLDELE